MDDLETAVRLNAAFEAAKLSTAMFSSLDDVRPRCGGRIPLRDGVALGPPLARGDSTTGLLRASPSQ